MSRRRSGSVLQAPGPPALIDVIKPSPKPAMEMSTQQTKKKDPMLIRGDSPVHDMVQLAARPIRLHTEKCLFSSCLWPRRGQQPLIDESS